MKEEIINDIAKATNFRYVFLFNITDKDGNFIGNYSLRRDKENKISLERNDIFDNGDIENRNASFKLTKKDKFPAEAIDYMTSEMIDEKDLLSFYNLLKTNEDLYNLDLDDLNVKSYMVHSKHYKGYNNNHFRENIYNSKDMAHIAEKQLDANINGRDDGNKSSQILRTDSLTDTRYTQMRKYMLSDMKKGNLLYKVATGDTYGLEEKTAFDKIITTTYDSYTLDRLTNSFDTEFQRASYMSDKLNEYLAFRDTYHLMTKYQALFNKYKREMAAQKGETVVERPQERKIPVVEESFKPKVKQLTLYDLIDPKKNIRK